MLFDNLTISGSFQILLVSHPAVVRPKNSAEELCCFHHVASLWGQNQNNVT